MSQAEQAFQAFLDLVQAGKAPNLEEYINSCEASIRTPLRAKLEEYSSLVAQFQGSPVVPRPGSKLGDFRLGREIGRGGMGVVWEAEQISVQRRVALKLLYPIYSIAPTVIRRFQREASAAGRINHPAVVRVLTAGEQNGLHYLAMDLIPGSRTLELALEDGSFQVPESSEDIQRIAEFFMRLASGLSAAHRAGVVHRDLKPGNILIDQDGNPKIADFGLARLEGAILFTQTGAQTGTPCFMSPEQVQGQSDATFSTDIFSFGSTLYQALTGQRAFEGATRESILLKILNEPPTPAQSLNPSIPRDLAVICARCLDKEPKRRFQSADELAEELERFVEAKPILSRPPGPLERAWRWSLRNRAMAAFIASVCGGLVISGLMLVKINWALQSTERAMVAATELTGLMDPDGRLINRGQSLDRLASLFEASQDLYSHKPEALSLQLFRIGRAYRFLEDWESSKEVLELSLSHALQMTHRDFELELDIQLLLGWVLGRLEEDNPVRRAENLDRALKLLIEVEKNSDIQNPSQTWRTLAARNRIGVIYLDMGEVEQADEWLSKCIHWGQENPGSHSMLISLSILDLGILREREGNYSEAVELGTRALQRYKRDVSRLHPEVGYTYNALGLAVSRGGDKEKGMELQEKGLEALSELLGEEHPTVRQITKAMKNLTSPEK
ncbi:MAG: serine/threonine-protein kinase [Planctomycetota bacterium]|nr:serine/threonine-protein kinase [Planctomycetota bacterium]